MPPKKTPENYHELARQAGFIWLGPEVKSSQTKTFWRCKNGHEWACIYSSIQQGHGCPYCANNLPKNPDDYHKLAHAHNFEWLGPEVKNVNSKTSWRCEYGHEWKSVYANIQQGYGCPVCGGSLRKQPSDYEGLAKLRGFEWLGPIVPNNKSRTNWRCNNGHIWQAPYSSIQQGNDCYYCQKNTRKFVSDYQEIARQRSFEWLGPEVSDTQTKTYWKCSVGHIWQATYSKLKLGRGCPYCANRIPKDKSAYQKLASKLGFKWIGSEIVNTHTPTFWQCRYGHQWTATYHSLDTGKTGCPYCAGNMPKKPKDYYALAQKLKIKWLGPEVSNVMEKTWWECSRGHKWHSPYSMINSGYGCPKCLDMVNGKLVSSPQRVIAKVVGGLLNFEVGRYSVDVALQRHEQLIAIEYDAWYWHGNRQKNDMARDQALNADGWRVLRIKSNKLTPDKNQIEKAIDELLNGKWYCEIILADWGKGPTSSRE